MGKVVNRRDFLRTSIRAGTAISLPVSVWADNYPSDIVSMPALQLSQAIREKKVSCLEVMQAYLAQITRYNPIYNAIVSIPSEQELLEQAKYADADLAGGNYRGWMHGMPHAVKDLQPVAGLRHTSGSPMFADRIADQDSELSASLRAAGVIFIGKTNVPEFGLGSQSYNPIFGSTGSAWNPKLTAGGSSGGAASALGTHMLPVADGSDFMGSLRNPGAFNNVIGFRPTVNTVNPVTENQSEPRPLSTAGPMGRNTADTIALLNTIASNPIEAEFSALDLSSSRLAWMGNLDGYLAMEAGIVDLCEKSLKLLSDAGATVEATTPRFNFSDLWLCFTTLRHGGRTSLRPYWDDSETRDMLKPELAWEIQEGIKITDADMTAANQLRQAWYVELNRLFNQYDFLVWPTAQVFPYSKKTPWPVQIDGREMDTYHRWMEVVIYGSLGGLPVVNVPVGFDAANRPMGMQVIGRFGEDKKVLELALAYEEVTNHLDIRPKLISAV
ncbi:MAG: amidase [Gammaproteobacteria bacterium]|nr:amidase [Gammaproteobacteria bacterium]